MSAIRSGATVVLASIACVGLLYLSASGEGPVTQPSTRPAEQPGYVVKKGALSFEIEAEGTIQAADPVEVRLRPKVYSGPFTITAAAPHGAMVKKGDVLL